MKRCVTPTLIQMDSLECGAVSLGIILGYYKKYVPLEQLRIDCKVSRGGSSLNRIIEAAEMHGMASEYRVMGMADLENAALPMIIHWNFNHFVVLEGFDKKKYYINDPAIGRRSVSFEEMDRSFTGYCLQFKPTKEFKPSGKDVDWQKIWRRYLEGSATIVKFIVIVGFFLMITGLVIPICSRIFVDNVLVGGQAEWLFNVIVLLLFMSTMQIVLTIMRDKYLLRWRTSLSAYHSGETAKKLLLLPIAFFQQRFIGDLINRIDLNIKISQMLTDTIAKSFVNIVSALFFLVMMAQYDLLLTGIAVIWALINIIFFKLFLRWRVDAKILLLQENSLLKSSLISGIKIIETIKASGGEKEFFNRLCGQATNVININRNLSVASRILQVVPQVFVSISSMLILVVGGYKLMHGSMTLGDFTAFQLLTVSFLAPINELVSVAGRCQEATAEVLRVNDILYHENETSFAAERGKESVLSSLEGNVEFRDVFFGYSKMEKPVLQNLSFKVCRGNAVALIGPSGSGKSTVAKLLAGLYSSWQGEVLIDGYQRTELARELLTACVGMVSQEAVLFEASVKENITMFDETITLQDVQRAAQDACIHQEIIDYFGGYDGTVTDRGKNLSGGQRQRMEIARVLCRNPQVVILDEATSALDPIVEKKIMDNILQRGCSLIVIAQRLSAIRDCNEIIVLVDGKVVQRGKHDDLVSIAGAYCDLINSNQL